MTSWLWLCNFASLLCFAFTHSMFKKKIFGNTSIGLRVGIDRTMNKTCTIRARKSISVTHISYRKRIRNFNLIYMIVTNASIFLFFFFFNSFYNLCLVFVIFFVANYFLIAHTKLWKMFNMQMNDSTTSLFIIA